MNGVPAILLIASTAFTTASTLCDGKKKKALLLSGIGSAAAACAVAAIHEVKNRAKAQKSACENADCCNCEENLVDSDDTVVLEPEVIPAE